MKHTPDPRSDPEWYSTHRDELDRRAAEAIRSGKAKPLTEKIIQERLKAARESKPVTIRLQVADIELAKAQAERKGLAYQTYLKSLLHQALVNEK